MNGTEQKAPSYEEAYQRLRAAYAARLEQSLEAIAAMLAQPAPPSHDEMVKMQSMAHGLAGSGATFGFPAVTDAGRKAELFLDKALKSLLPDQAMDEEELAEFKTLLQELQKACLGASKSEDKKPVEPGAPLKSDAAPGEFHVLVVDDDKNIGDLVSMQLQQRGVRVTVSRDGESAMQVIGKNPLDLIILDISMPGMNGHAVLKRLKQDPAFVTIPVLMLTSKSGQEDIVSALHSGAMDYVLKPFDPEKLIARIEKILDAGRYTVLIADNDPLILRLLDSKFKQRGFTVKLAGDGKEAWTQIQKALPDLVILDRMMPGMEGLDVVKHMRAEASTKNIPVIILSARKEERDMEMGKKVGAQDYVAKPFTPDDLLSRSMKLLKPAAK